MSRPPALRAFQENDFKDTARFLSSIFGEDASRWQSWFAHWWRANPAWNESIPRGWLVRSAGGKPIAFTANIPFRYVIEGKPGLCCVTGSTSVDAAWRRQGLAAMVGKAFLDQPQADLLLGIDSSHAAYRLWQALGMKSLERRWQQINYRVIADAAALTTRLAATAHLPKFVGAVAGRCAAALMLPITIAAERSRTLAIDKVDRFLPQDGDALESCVASDASTYACRDARTLDWLYFGSPYVRGTRAVFVARSGPQLVGYLAMKRRDPHSYGLLECRTKNADRDIARELIFAARAFAQQQQVRYIVARPYTPMITFAIPRAVSIRLNGPKVTYCYQFRTPLKDESGWETSPSDGDVSVN